MYNDKKKNNDWLFDSNNMLLNNIWNKQASDERKKNAKNKVKTYNIKITDNTSDTEKFVFCFISIDSMVFPFVWIGLGTVFPDLLKTDNIILKVIENILTIIAVYCLFAWIIAPIFFKSHKLADIIDDFACKVAKKFR